MYRADPIVLSFVQAEELQKAKKEHTSSITLSPDLGISTVTVELSDNGTTFP